MESNDEILDEIRGISPLLASMSKKQVFLIPGDYFRHLEAKLLENRNCPVLTSISKTTSNIPTEYFNQLPEEILKLIKSTSSSPTEELKKVSPLLYALKSENPLIIPPDYFNQFEHNILFNVEPQTRLIRLKKRNSAWQYARAAVMTGVIAISALMVYNTQAPFGIVSGRAEYIESGRYKSEQQINEGISKLPDEEVIKYLENSGDAADNENSNSMIEESQLPDKTEYPDNNTSLDKLMDLSPGVNPQK